MAKQKLGSCNYCGKCCQNPVVMANPCIEPAEKICKFYTATDNLKLYGHCLVIGRTGDIDKVLDRFGGQIIQDQIDWHLENCVDYPALNVSGVAPELPNGCGFSFSEVI